MGHEIPILTRIYYIPFIDQISIGLVVERLTAVAPAQSQPHNFFRYFPESLYYLLALAAIGHLGSNLATDITVSGPEAVECRPSPKR